MHPTSVCNKINNQIYKIYTMSIEKKDRIPDKHWAFYIPNRERQPQTHEQYLAEWSSGGIYIAHLHIPTVLAALVYNARSQGFLLKWGFGDFRHGAIGPEEIETELGINSEAFNIYQYKEKMLYLRMNVADPQELKGYGLKPDHISIAMYNNWNGAEVAQRVIYEVEKRTYN